MTDTSHLGLSAVEKAISAPTTIAEQMDALIEQIETATAKTKALLHQLELIRKAVG